MAVTPAAAAVAWACSGMAGEESMPITRVPVASATGIATLPVPTASLQQRAIGSRGGSSQPSNIAPDNLRK